MLRNPLQAYDQGNKATDSNRRLEASALFKTARMLEDCQRDWDRTGGDDRLREALKLNQTLWSLFQSNLAQEELPLPAPLRVNLLRLSAFVDRRTFEVMSEPAPEKLTALIDINRQLAAGLSTGAA